jgi:hypothetical protein
VLFDVGGPLDTEIEHERLIEAAIRGALPVSDAEYAAAVRAAVDSFAPNAYQAIIWRLAGFDLDESERAYAAVARAPRRDAIEIRRASRSCWLT